MHASLTDAAGQGLVVYDLLHGVYRHRPLLHTPLPPEVTLGADPQEQEARALVARKAAAIVGTRRVRKGRSVAGIISALDVLKAQRKPASTAKNSKKAAGARTAKAR